MALTRKEIAFLEDLARWQQEHNGEARLLKYPTHPLVKDLADRGFVELCRALSGPLGIATGEEMVSLTEAGEIAIKNLSREGTTS